MRRLAFCLCLLLVSALSCIRSFRGVSATKNSSNKEIYRSNDGLALMKIERASSLGITATITNTGKQPLDIDLSLAAQTVRWNEKPESLKENWYEGCEQTSKKTCQNSTFILSPNETKKVHWYFDLRDNGKFAFPILSGGQVVDNFNIIFEKCPRFMPCR